MRGGCVQYTGSGCGSGFVAQGLGLDDSVMLLSPNSLRSLLRSYLDLDLDNLVHKKTYNNSGSR